MCLFSDNPTCDHEECNQFYQMNKEYQIKDSQDDGKLGKRDAIQQILRGPDDFLNLKKLKMGTKKEPNLPPYKNPKDHAGKQFLLKF